MKLATLAAILGVAALLFFAFGCAQTQPPVPSPGGNGTPSPPTDIPPPPPDSGTPATPQPSAPPAPPTGGDAPPPAPV